MEAVRVGANNVSGDLNFYTKGAGGANTAAPTQKMVIKADGKVGINCDPTYTLDVAGDVGVNEYIYHNGDTNTYLRFLTDRFQIRTDGDDRIDVQSNGLTKFTPDVQIGIKQRNVSTWQTEFLIYGSTSTNWDMTAYDEGGSGNSFLVIATWAHYAADSHSLALVALVHTRGTAIHQHTIYNHTHSNNGSFTISKASNSTLRITKNAGTYGGSGRGFISVTSYNNT